MLPDPRFVRWLRQTVTWDFAVAPLAPNALNQAKNSGLKFLDKRCSWRPRDFQQCR